MVREDEYLSANQELIGAIKSAIQRGETLKQSMMTLYRAGYDKSEIETAAKVYLDMQTTQRSELSELQKERMGQKEGLKLKPSKEIKKPIENIQEPQSQEPPKIQEKPENSQRTGSAFQKEMEQKKIKAKKEKTKQKISDYDKLKKPKIGKITTYILIFTLLILLGFLILVIFYKEKIIDFVNTLFNS